MGNLRPQDRLCLALDVDSQSAARQLAQEVSSSVGLFKIGFELFTSEGPPVVTAVQEAEGRVFLDLKYHDIPSTVAGGVRAATRLGVEMMNLHALGGRAMMQAAAKAAGEEADRLGRSRPKLLAVTVLTSIGEAELQSDLLVRSRIREYVVHLARLAQDEGVDGVIASPQEISSIRAACGEGFLIGTPGIRPPGAPPDDQKRTLTPAEAITAGADFIVVGRPIRSAPEPAKAAEEILREIRDALAGR